MYQQKMIIIIKRDECQLSKLFLIFLPKSIPATFASKSQTVSYIYHQNGRIKQQLTLEPTTSDDKWGTKQVVFQYRWFSILLQH